MQWLFEGSDEAPDVPGLGAARRAHRRGSTATPSGGSRFRTSAGTRSTSRGAGATARRAWPPGAQVYFTHSLRRAGHRRHASPSTDARRTRSPSVVERGQRLRRAVPPGEIGRRRAADPAQLPASWCGYSASMLSKRIIACLDVRDGQVVKGINFEGLRHAGDPAELARRYNVEGIDELVILDITATLETPPGAGATRSRAVARELFIPLDGRRRHPHRRRCRGGGRGRRGQGQPEHRGARRTRRSSRRWRAATAARRSSSRSTPSGDGRSASPCTSRSGTADADARRGRVGARGRVARRRRDPADVDRSRRHARPASTAR